MATENTWKCAFSGLEINTRKLAKCEWFLEAVSKKKYPLANIPLLEFGGGKGNVLGEFCGETEGSTHTSRIVYGKEETGLTREPLTVFT